MNIPSREEIIGCGSIEQEAVCKNFLGKNIDEAEDLFRCASIVYQEDLMWMGIVAFRYYVNAAINYIRSSVSKGDSGVVNCFAGVLEFRIESDSHQDLAPIADDLASICEYIIKNFEKFDVEIYIYGNVHERFALLYDFFVRLKQNNPSIEPDIESPRDRQTTIEKLPSPSDK